MNKEITFNHNKTNDYFGFIYKSYVLYNKKQYIYIGRKNYLKKVKDKYKESDWKTYRSSNKIVKEYSYKFELIRECKTKKELSIYEAYYILDNYIKGYSILNKWIECKINL